MLYALIEILLMQLMDTVKRCPMFDRLPEDERQLTKEDLFKVRMPVQLDCSRSSRTELASAYG